MLVEVSRKFCYKFIYNFFINDNYVLNLFMLYIMVFKKNLNSDNLFNEKVNRKKYVYRCINIL